MRPSKEIIGASTSLLVLAAIARQPSYGYQLVKQINASADGLFSWSEGTIYPVLHKLEKDELIRSQWRQANGQRQRKYYHITAKGRLALARDAEQWNDFTALIGRLTGARHATDLA